MTEVTPEKLRLDKWLWMARFFKTRGKATETVAAGHVRVNGHKALKPATQVGAGDVLTFSQGNVVRVVRITGLPARRGPAPEAQGHYEDLTEPQEAVPPNPRYEGKGRPTKRDRRTWDVSRDGPIE